MVDCGPRTDGTGKGEARPRPHPDFEPDSRRVDEIRPARNHGERVGEGHVAAGGPDMLLLHYTGMDDEEAAVDWLTRGSDVVSCHYFVHSDGRVLQFLPEALRAHHAGVSCWDGEHDNNSRSVGIEIANPGHLSVERGGDLPLYPPEQMKAVVELCGDIATRLDLSPGRVVAHSDVAPERKLDPGEHFDWRLLHEAGVGEWAEPGVRREGACLREGMSGEGVRRLQHALASYGYHLEATGHFDERTRIVLAAFQRHFRPAQVDGVADAVTFDVLERLLDNARGSASHDACAT